MFKSGIWINLTKGRRDFFCARYCCTRPTRQQLYKGKGRREVEARLAGRPQPRQGTARCPDDRVRSRAAGARGVYLSHSVIRSNYIFSQKRLRACWRAAGGAPRARWRGSWPINLMGSNVNRRPPICSAICKSEVVIYMSFILLRVPLQIFQKRFSTF